MQNHITIPLNYLQAARLFTAKKDISRPYLQGVALQSGYAAGTNGAYIGAVYCNGIDPTLPEIIIPNKAIDTYIKKAGRSKFKDVAIQWDDERNIVIGNNMHVEHCKGVEGKFPHVLRILPTHVAAPGAMTQYPWAQMALFEKAADILCMTRKPRHKAYLLPDGPDRAARVVLPHVPSFVGAIMPLRSAEIDLGEYGHA